jgi:hypothetical protein
MFLISYKYDLNIYDNTFCENKGQIKILLYSFYTTKLLLIIKQIQNNINEYYKEKWNFEGSYTDYIFFINDLHNNMSDIMININKNISDEAYNVSSDTLKKDHIYTLKDINIISESEFNHDIIKNFLIIVNFIYNNINKDYKSTNILNLFNKSENDNNKINKFILFYNDLIIKLRKINKGCETEYYFYKSKLLYIIHLLSGLIIFMKINNELFKIKVEDLKPYIKSLIKSLIIINPDTILYKYEKIYLKSLLNDKIETINNVEINKYMYVVNKKQELVYLYPDNYNNLNKIILNETTIQLTSLSIIEEYKKIIEDYKKIIKDYLKILGK